MKLLNDNILAEVADDIEVSDGLLEDDKDFLKSLENKASEVGEEADSIELERL